MFKLFVGHRGSQCYGFREYVVTVPAQHFFRFVTQNPFGTFVPKDNLLTHIYGVHSIDGASQYLQHVFDYHDKILTIQTTDDNTCMISQAAALEMFEIPHSLEIV